RERRTGPSVARRARAVCLTLGDVCDHRRLRHRAADPAVPNRTTYRHSGCRDPVVAHPPADRHLHSGHLPIHAAVGHGRNRTWGRIVNLLINAACSATTRLSFRYHWPIRGASTLLLRADLL